MTDRAQVTAGDQPIERGLRVACRLQLTERRRTANGMDAGDGQQAANWVIPGVEVGSLVAKAEGATNRFAWAVIRRRGGRGRTVAWEAQAGRGLRQKVHHPLSVVLQPALGPIAHER